VHVCAVLPMSIATPFFDHAGNSTGHEIALAAGAGAMMTLPLLAS